MNLAALIPVIVIVLLLWLLTRRAEAWVVVVAMLLGVILSGTFLGSDIATILSQVSGGRLH